MIDGTISRNGNKQGLFKCQFPTRRKKRKEKKENKRKEKEKRLKFYLTGHNASNDIRGKKKRHHLKRLFC